MIKLAALLLILALQLSAEWITPKGKAYHTQRDCIALRTTKEPKYITRAEADARGLKACGICTRWRKPAK
jgi:hypothetical protein